MPAGAGGAGGSGGGLHHLAATQHGDGPQLRVGDDDVGPQARPQRPHGWVAEDLRALDAGGVDGVDQVDSPLPGGAHDVDEVGGPPGDRAALGEAGNAVGHGDRLGAEHVVAVGHTGRRHGVGDQDDVVTPQGLKHVQDDGGAEVHAVADHLQDALAALGGRQELGHGPGRAVVHGAHAVEQVGGGRARGADRFAGLEALGDAGGGVGQGGTHGGGLGVGVPEGGQRPALDEGSVDAVVAGDAGLLRGDGHGDDVPAAELDELAGQGGVGVDDVGGVLGAAALHRDEGPLEVDAGELSVLAQPGQDPGACAQDIGGGRHAGGHERGGAKAAVLEHGDHGLLGGLGVGEGLAAPAVAVDVHQSRQEVAPLGCGLGLLDGVCEAGPGGLVSGPDPRDVGSGQDDRPVVDDVVGGDDASPQCVDLHGFVAHESDSVTTSDIRQPPSGGRLSHTARAGAGSAPFTRPGAAPCGRRPG